MADPLKMPGKKHRTARYKQKKRLQFRGKKERLRAKNELLESQVKKAEEVNKSIIAKKSELAQENLLLKR